MNIRKLLESYQESYSFTGTCVNSFDADTMEYTNSSAMSDINDLAWLDEEYVNDANNVITTDIDKLKGYIPPLEKELPKLRW